MELAGHLGIETLTLPIDGVMEAMASTLREAFAGTTPDTTEENIQARIRGNLLMALSNKRQALLLSTGNKSELAVGYCTLYGDMSGGLAVIADVPKTMVYRVARWLNATSGRPVIPQSSLDKAPSAELKPNQTDQDSLPPYDVLDEILVRHIERHETAKTIIAAGLDPATVRRVLRLVRAAEFKRKQAAPGLKVTDRAFGTGWRMPIAARRE
jgi:NAD+ synthase/NAD+ synthase (glutamine-hydrolysing)